MIALLFALLLEQFGLFSLVRFTRERIEITVSPDHFVVDGIYFYQNPLPIPWIRGLSIPFFKNDDQSPPATVEVSEMNSGNEASGHELAVRWIKDKPYFSVMIPPLGLTRVRVRFTQYAPKGEGTYLLTTTQPWRRPLDLGDYVLHPEGVRITGSSYALDNADRLSFSRRNFMPEKNWTFSWAPEVKQ
jgi:hypothetical protein